jgi:hypothetical protein
MQGARLNRAARIFCSVVAAVWCGAAVAQGQKPSTESLPGSRDELFGTKPAAGAPASDKPFSLSGFYDFLGAYTYSDPTHWSRAVNRFQLSAQGSLGANVRWRIGGRVDVDPVYASSDFYLPDVRNDQKFDAFWRETYVDFSAAGWDFRVGAQNIVWGEVVGLFFADVVSALDLREFVLPSFDILRKPQWAARAEYFKGDAHLELVWIPFQTFDDIGEPGSDFYPARLPSPTPGNVAAAFLDPEKPSQNLGNSAYGVRANTLVGGWDLAVFYYRNFANSPTFFRLASVNPTLPFVFQPRYERIWQAGGTVSKDFGQVVARAELVYADGRSYASTDPNAPEGVVRKDTFDWIVSADFTLPREVRLNLQAFQRLYSGGDSTLALQTGSFGVSAQISGKVTPTLEPQLLWMQTFGGGGGLIRPRVNWTPIRNTVIGVGVDIFTGPDDGLFGRYNNRDRVYTEVRYDF